MQGQREGHCPQAWRADRNPPRAGVLDGRMKNPWSMAGVSSLPTQTPLPQFPHYAVDLREPESEGAVALKRTVRKSQAISLLLLARVACVKVRIKPVGVGVGVGSSAGCFVWRSRLAVASVAENMGSGHARLRSNPITPCGWAPKIAPVSPIITAQLSSTGHLLFRDTVIINPSSASAGTCSEPALGTWFSLHPLLHHRGTQRCRGGLRARRSTHPFTLTPNLALQAWRFHRI